MLVLYLTGERAGLGTFSELLRRCRHLGGEFTVCDTTYVYGLIPIIFE